MPHMQTLLTPPIIIHTTPPASNPDRMNNKYTFKSGASQANVLPHHVKLEDFQLGRRNYKIKRKLLNTLMRLLDPFLIPELHI